MIITLTKHENMYKRFNNDKKIQNDDNLLTSSNRNVLDSRTFQNRFAVSYFTLKLGEKENKSTIVPNLGVMKTTPY